MRTHTIDNRKRDSWERKGTLVNRSFWLHDLPRLMPLCRLLGHKPVVDGYDSKRTGNSARWVCCDRCGVRPNTQGRLDPAVWNLGDRYTGPRADAPPDREALMALKLGDKPFEMPKHYLPGPWPTKSSGTVGGQFVAGKTFGGFGVQVAVGCAGDEHTLSGHIRINRLGALYLHTDGFGAWLQRRFNAVSYDTREIGISADDGRLHWKLWAKQNGWSSEDPKWQQGSVRIDPRDVLLGELRYSYTDVGEKVTTMVRMPHGDDHQVELQLKRQRHGRKHGRGSLAWSVSWDCREGIPTKPHGGEILGSAVNVSDEAAEDGTWPAVAAAAIAVKLTESRSRYGWRTATVA